MWHPTSYSENSLIEDDEIFTLISAAILFANNIICMYSSEMLVLINTIFKSTNNKLFILIYKVVIVFITGGALLHKSEYFRK